MLRKQLERHLQKKLQDQTCKHDIRPTINKWLGGGKLSLAKETDTDILRVIVINLQKRVQEKTATLLIKVKVHHGYPLTEETDI